MIIENNNLQNTTVFNFHAQMDPGKLTCQNAHRKDREQLLFRPLFQHVGSISSHSEQEYARSLDT